MTSSAHLPSKPSLLLSCGLLCDAAFWPMQRAALRDLADAQVLDLAGLDSVTQMAAHVLTVVPPQCALAGHSMGGRVALNIMRQTLARVRGWRCWIQKLRRAAMANATSHGRWYDWRTFRACRRWRSADCGQCYFSDHVADPALMDGDRDCIRKALRSDVCTTMFRSTLPVSRRLVGVRCTTIARVTLGALHCSLSMAYSRVRVRRMRRCVGAKHRGRCRHATAFDGVIAGTTGQL